MPETAPKAAKKMKFDSGFLSDVSTISDNGKLDADFRSFMDKGESVFANDQGRNEVAEGVRRTILAKLREENRASKRDALLMERRQDEFGRTEIQPVIEEAKTAERKSRLAYAGYLQALARTSVENAQRARNEIDEIVNAARAQLPLEAPQIQEPHAEHEPEVIQDIGEGNGAGGAQEPEVNPENPSVIPEQSGEQIQEQEHVQEPEPVAEVNPGQAVLPNQVPGAGQEDPILKINREDETSVRDRQSDINELNELQTDIRINAGERRGFFRTINNNFFAGARLKSARKAQQRAHEKVTGLRLQIENASNRWINIRERYRATAFREHYRKYDRLASSYYALSRSLNKDERTIRDDLQGAGQAPGGVRTSKDIAEYTGEFDSRQIHMISNSIPDNPYSLPPVLKKINGRQIKEGSLNTQDAQHPIKYHHAMVFQAYAEGIKTRADEQAAAEGQRTRIRMKLLNDFSGYRARNQYRDHVSTALQDSMESREERGKLTGEQLLAARAEGRETGTAAGQMNLVVDEKGANNELLRSEKSAKIYSVRRRGGGNGDIRGFYIHGEFFSEDYTAMQDMSQSKGVNWEKAGQEEALRLAIRRSDFFRHVNAATIQYYTTYDANTYYENEIGGARADLINRPATERPKVEEQGDFEVVERDPAEVAVQVLDSYIDGKNQIIGPRCTINEVRAKVNEVLAGGDKMGAIRLATVMLAEDIPELWDLAKDIAIRLGGRYKYKAERVNAGGYMMRIGLLEEFGKNRTFDWANIGESLLPDKLRIHIEELAARRDGFVFSTTILRQSFWDGSLLGALTGTFSAATKDVATMKFEGDIKQVCNEFNMNYGEAAGKASRNFGIVLAPVPGVIAAATGGIDKEGNASDAANYSLSALGTFQTLVDFVQNIAKLVRQIQLIKKAKNNKEPLRVLVVDLLTLIANILGNIVDFVFWWIDRPVIRGIIGAIGAVKNVLSIVKNTIGEIMTRKEINKITSVDSEMETALTEYQAKAESLRQLEQAVTEDALETRQQKEGLAGENNSQAQYFLALAKSRARRARKMAISEIASNTIGAIGNTIGFSSKFAWINPVAFPFKLAAKAVDFIGWTVGKIHDVNHFTENVAQTLGDAKYAKYAGFNEALKRETGIQNKYYLVDLARVFMAIDTHHMLKKENKSDGEASLVITMMQPFISMKGTGEEKYGARKEENLAKLKDIKLEKIMAALGAPAGDWRALLRASVTG